MGFKKNPLNDQSIWFNPEIKTIIIYYIDDILIFAKSRNIINDFKAKLDPNLEITDLKNAKFLGIEIIRNRKERTLKLT